MHRVRNPEVTSLSLELSLTLLNKEKGYIFPWIKSNTEKTVTVKTIEFISTDIAWHWDKCLNCCHSNKCVGLMHAFSAIGFWLMALTKWCEGGRDCAEGPWRDNRAAEGWPQPSTEGWQVGLSRSQLNMRQILSAGAASACLISTMLCDRSLRGGGQNEGHWTQSLIRAKEFIKPHYSWMFS